MYITNFASLYLIADKMIKKNFRCNDYVRNAPITHVFPRGRGGDYPRELDFFFENLGSNSLPMSNTFVAKIP